ncbi:MAG: imidazole glycerol phosphate synthase subunit HisH [Pseudomonadota bacterium]
MSVAIIDYGSGNLRSAQKAFEAVAPSVGGSGPIEVTADAEAVQRADRIVLPGVGAFADCLAGLSAVPGMLDVLEDRVRRAAVPFMGICVGMQLMATVGREHGDHPGLNWLPGEVVGIEPTGERRIPHMGWNKLVREGKSHPVFDGLGEEPHAYFVHGYSLRPADEGDRALSVDYEGPLVAAVARDNLVGTQFHPEKSQAVGQKIIANFLRWTP